MSRAPRSRSATPLAIAVATFLAASSIAGPARSEPPLHISYPVDVTYEIPPLTEVCGFAVWVRLEGTFKGTIHTSRSGLASELDTQPHTRFTTYSPETGRSFSVMFSTVFHTLYPDGLVAGGRVIADVTGFVDHVPGTHAAAGRTHFPAGEIVEVVDGVPYVNYGEPDLSHGSLYDGETEGDHLDALTCAHLAP